MGESMRVKPLEELMKYNVRDSYIYGSWGGGIAFNIEPMKKFCGKEVGKDMKINDGVYIWYFDYWMLESETDVAKRILETYEI
jgi:hypothetical protein